MSKPDSTSVSSIPYGLIGEVAFDCLASAVGSQVGNEEAFGQYLQSQFKRRGLQVSWDDTVLAAHEETERLPVLDLNLAVRATQLEPDPALELVEDDAAFKKRLGTIMLLSRQAG